MHQCLDTISEKSDFNSILVDGNHFRTYYNPVKDEFIDHECIIKGDNKYKSIAAASILAKTHRDNYILDLVKRYPDLEKYDIQNNKGYGTKKHMDAIKKYGITQWHRNTFAPCKGLESPYSSLRAINPGISVSAMAISFKPHSAVPISFTLKSSLIFQSYFYYKFILILL